LFKKYGKKLSSITNEQLNAAKELYSTINAEGVTRELGGRADKGFRPYTSLIKATFMGRFTG